MHQAVGGTNFGPVYTHKDFERVKNSRSEEGWKVYAIKRGFNDSRLNNEIIMDYGANSRLVTETFSRSSKPIEEVMQNLQVTDSQSEVERRESYLKQYPSLTVKRMNGNPRGEETRPPSHYASECGDSVAAQETSGPPKQQGSSFALSAPFPNDPRKVTSFGQTLRSSSSFLRSPGVTAQEKPPSIVAASMLQPRVQDFQPYTKPPSIVATSMVQPRVQDFQPQSKPPSIVAASTTQPRVEHFQTHKPPSIVSTSTTQPRIKDFQPFFDRVVVERLAAETEPKGGNSMLQEKAQSMVLEATVVAIGPGYRTAERNTVPLQVKVGDRVLVPECGGSKVVIDEKEYHIFREGDIIGKFADGRK